MAKISLKIICFLVVGVLVSIFELHPSWGQERVTPTVRAKWVDSSHLIFPLSTIISATNSKPFAVVPEQGNKSTATPALSFWLYYGDYNAKGFPFDETQRIQLRVKDYAYGKVVLDTSSLKDQIPWLIKQKLAVLAEDQSGQMVDMTYLQTGDLLDGMFYYDGDDLGLTFEGQRPKFKLWAPTARKVRLHVYSSSDDPYLNSAIQVDLTPLDQGVWQVSGESAWYGKYYLYEVEVFVPSTGQIHRNFVTDPYSTSLAVGSQKSHIIDVNDQHLMPQGWLNFKKPGVVAPEDIVIYEAHLRDMTMADPTVPAAYKGTYLAPTLKNTNFRTHLKNLADAGLTHIHLLPIFDFASVPEIASKRIEPVIPNAGPDSSSQQAAIGASRKNDGYNWGYDPYHYFVPDGSYATSPKGENRIREVRSMVQAFNDMGLRVVMDVVFNHTLAAGLAPESVLDKVVPGYFYRLDHLGRVYNSSCCSDTASERLMMEKLMIDAVKFWARTYKIDGFRFDLMNLHTVTNLKRIRQALDEMTLAKDGVDGKNIYLYGEGWRFGSLEATRPGESMHQLNAYGSGIGTFNDRIRDAIRGGTTSPKEKSDQGFATGLYYDFNHEPANRNTPVHRSDQKTKLLHLADVIRVGLAGNLRDYWLKDSHGTWRRGSEIYFQGSPTGYAADPEETVNYVSAHDGYTLWDAIAAKAPFFAPYRTPSTATVEEKVRMHNLSLSLVALSQGIPFFTAGTDMLRSKSGDTDSYDSGDWFNQIDFSYETNRWGIGLPVAWKNQSDWPFWQPRLIHPDLKVRRDHITGAARYFEALLRVRKSTPLFRLRNKDDIAKRVQFLNADLGAAQVPGLIAMSISDNEKTGADLDPEFEKVLVLFNAHRNAVTLSHAQLQNLNLRLHPDLNEQVDPILSQISYDPISGRIQVPGRTTVVYVVPQREAAY